jgi:hypothetical protein
MMLQLLTALLAFSLLAQAAPRDSRAINLLLAYKADLKALEAELKAAPLPAIPGQRACITQAKPGWWLYDSAGKKQKLAEGQSLELIKPDPVPRKTGLFSKSSGWMVRWNKEEAWLPAKGERASALQKICATHRLDWMNDSLDVIRQTGMNAFRQEQAHRELANIKEWTNRYRKQDGAHQQMDPVALLRGLAAPGAEEIGQHLPIAWQGQLPASDQPWGYDRAVPPVPIVLFFQSSEDDVWQLRDTEGVLYYIMPGESRDTRYPGLGSFARELEERYRAARRYQLLQRWELKIVDRIMQGLAWKGMSEEMLQESLGEASEVIDTGAGSLWRYAMGNEVLLKDGKVVEIRQDK